MTSHDADHLTDIEAREEASMYLSKAVAMSMEGQHAYLSALLQRVYAQAFLAGYDRAAAVVKRMTP